MDKSEKPTGTAIISDRADTVIAELERAISEILDATEHNADLLQQIHTLNVTNPDTNALVAQITNTNQRIFAACSVQDVIRQHLNILIKDIENGGQPSQEDIESEKLLAGPQLDGQVLDQQDIDDLLK